MNLMFNIQIKAVSTSYKWHSTAAGSISTELIEREDRNGVGQKMNTGEEQQLKAELKCNAIIKRLSGSSYL